MDRITCNHQQLIIMQDINVLIPWLEEMNYKFYNRSGVFNPALNGITRIISDSFIWSYSIRDGNGGAFWADKSTIVDELMSKWWSF